MTKLYFDNSQGMILVDGTVCREKTTVVDNSFCIQYIPFDSNFLPIYCAVRGKASLYEDILFIRHGKDYIVRFCPRKKPIHCQSALYMQKILEPNNSTAHCLTCHIEDGYKMSVETQNELITLETPCKVNDVKFSCIPISSGQLICVFAQLENCKQYIAVLHYKDDYTLLLDICCDEVFVEEDGLRVCDYLRDSLNRKCIRKLSFCGDCFAEQSRHFENVCSHNYIDEILPYVLLESACYGDVDCARNCLCPALKNCDIHEIFGDFVGICDCLDYNPYCVTLLYSDCEGLYTKTFRFDVAMGKIQKIK